MDKNADKLILIADDQESDQHMLVRALQRLGVLNPVHRVTDGHEAIRYLNGDTPYNDRANYPFPAIIFLIKQTMEEQFRDLLVRYSDVWEFADPSAPSVTPRGPQPSPSA